jgi:anti-sigma-K factor RskA
MDYSEDDIALAAEYALGTLDGDERAQVETMMSEDKDFTAIVRAWEYRLGVLNQMVGAVEPRPELWERIQAAAGLAEPQAAIVLPDPPPPPARSPEPAERIAEPVAPAADNSNVILLSSQARRWRGVARVTSALAAALLAMIGIEILAPDLLPEALRPKPRTQVVEVKSPAPTPVPSAQYAALLQGQGGMPAFILTVDGTTKTFTLRKIGASVPEPSKSYELWLISDKLPRPRSLGIVGGGDFTTRPVLASYDADVISNATYAVTIEQAGGSPDGAPHSAPVFAGRLIQTVPPG